MKAQFITEDIPEIKFEPLKGLKPYELYMGTSIDGNPIICSMIKYPHIIIQGATGMGKTKLIDCMITNLITQCSPDDLSLYFIQADKSDQIVYRKCKHTRAYADTLEKALAITNYLKEIVNHRDKVLRPLIEDGICDNILDFNKVCNKYNQTKFSYIYLIVDEYSSLMPSDSDIAYNKTIKLAIQNNMERLIQVGRYVGVYITVGLQRGTVDKLPSFIKAMCNTVATFRVNNEKSSYVAIDSNEAVTLNPREAIIKTNEKELAKTVTLTAPMIVNHIKPFKVKSLEYKDFPYESFLNLNDLFNKKKKNKKKPKNQNKETSENTNNTTSEQNINTKTKLNDKELKVITKESIVKTLSEDKTKNQELNPIINNDNINNQKKEEVIKFSVPKPKNPYYIENWEDFSKKSNIKVIDKTKIDLSKTEKPIKKEIDK